MNAAFDSVKKAMLVCNDRTRCGSPTLPWAAGINKSRMRETGQTQFLPPLPQAMPHARRTGLVGGEKSSIYCTWNLPMWEEGGTANS